MNLDLPDMTRWTDERLEREMSIAASLNESGVETKVWNAALDAEAKRRGWPITIAKGL